MLLDRWEAGSWLPNSSRWSKARFQEHTGAVLRLHVSYHPRHHYPIRTDTQTHMHTFTWGVVIDFSRLLAFYVTASSSPKHNDVNYIQVEILISRLRTFARNTEQKVLFLQGSKCTFEMHFGFRYQWPSALLLLDVDDIILSYLIILGS